MRRRDFMLSAAALGVAGGALFESQQRFSASVDYPGRDQGHRLRDAKALPQPEATIETDVLIVGSGIGALTAAWQLFKLGVRDVLIVGGPEHHGNAAGGRDGALKFPTGAHYLPLPSLQSVHIREMLYDFGVIQRDPYGERPTYDERYIVHSPAERVLYRGAWAEGHLPTEEVSAAERDDHARFFAMVDWYSAARGSDGRRAFTVPLQLSSDDDKFRALDRITFKTWLEGVELKSPTLHWYLDYCCRDDYGRQYDEVSAWAGLHYFCARDGMAANAERGAVLTWPEGLAALASRLESSARAPQDWLSGSVAQLHATAAGVDALVISPEGGPKAVRVKARQAIAAIPLFVLQHVFTGIGGYGFVPQRDVPGYAPWLVSNFIMHAFPEERPGAPLSWDNVIYKEPGLGYVVSTHQEIRASKPKRSAFTAYKALCDLEPEAGRRWLNGASTAQLLQAAAADLKLAYGWRLPLCVEHVAITARGHAMAIPEPGFLSNPGRLNLRNAAGPIFFAHSDLSGLSLFEEAAWWGHLAARRLAATRGMAPVPK